jgi:MOSC domain-containing protein YiiM
VNERTVVNTFAPLPAPAVEAGSVVAVSCNPSHGFSKINQASIRLVTGLGVAGDAHFGQTVQHLVRVRDNPGMPNLRQVHLIPFELFEELRAAGFTVTPGEVGENVTTKGINLLKLPKGTRLHLGDTAVVELTGLRTPCRQLDRFQPGLLAEMTGRDEQGNLLIKSGVMGIVLISGTVRPDDTIRVALPQEPGQPLGKI